ncbi:hypothetical protein CBR_g16854 [Chara braunii]|uniref:Uncharacterized protein n=1 Tax=Chara braunii TaxID=69332 RepID=A0A388KTY1_CHABU|nr:hypothetical protein CBR_g16854 [Chara braunii]|eukprot:GBG73511.1 hypothetical protein CBR_g16854 [Chara braunii]
MAILIWLCPFFSDLGYNESDRCCKLGASESSSAGIRPPKEGDSSRKVEVVVPRVGPVLSYGLARGNCRHVLTAVGVPVQVAGVEHSYGDQGPQPSKGGLTRKDGQVGTTAGRRTVKQEDEARLRKVHTLLSKNRKDRQHGQLIGFASIEVKQEQEEAIAAEPMRPSSAKEPGSKSIHCNHAEQTGLPERNAKGPPSSEDAPRTKVIMPYSDAEKTGLPDYKAKMPSLPTREPRTKPPSSATEPSTEQRTEQRTDPRTRQRTEPPSVENEPRTEPPSSVNETQTFPSSGNKPRMNVPLSANEPRIEPTPYSEATKTGLPDCISKGLAHLIPPVPRPSTSPSVDLNSFPEADVLRPPKGPDHPCVQVLDDDGMPMPTEDCKEHSAGMSSSWASPSGQPSLSTHANPKNPGVPGGTFSAHEDAELSADTGIGAKGTTPRMHFTRLRKGPSNGVRVSRLQRLAASGDPVCSEDQGQTSSRKQEENGDPEEGEGDSDKEKDALNSESDSDDLMTSSDAVSDDDVSQVNVNDKDYQEEESKRQRGVSIMASVRDDSKRAHKDRIEGDDEAVHAAGEREEEKGEGQRIDHSHSRGTPGKRTLAKVKKMLRDGFGLQMQDLEAQRALTNAERLLTNHFLQLAESSGGGMSEVAWEKSLKGGCEDVTLKRIPGLNQGVKRPGRLRRTMKFSVDAWMVLLAAVIAENFDTDFFPIVGKTESGMRFYGVFENTYCSAQAYAAAFNWIASRSAKHDVIKEERPQYSHQLHPWHGSLAFTDSKRRHYCRMRPWQRSTALTRMAKDIYRYELVEGLHKAVSGSRQKRDAGKHAGKIGALVTRLRAVRDDMLKEKMPVSRKPRRAQALKPRVPQTPKARTRKVPRKATKEYIAVDQSSLEGEKHLNKRKRGRPIRKNSEGNVCTSRKKLRVSDGDRTEDSVSSESF